jgi:3-hydroxyacyl-CoA dehydrogenase/enoyl-CoA hydratase/3-hydroxybutyryl-CoA epimerase
MNIFFAQNALKKDNGVTTRREPRARCTRVGMLGAGLMGAGIAYVTATRRAPVRLKDAIRRAWRGASKYVREIVDGRVKRKRMTRQERDRAARPRHGHDRLRGMKGCEVVIEAVFEDLALKHRVLATTEAVGGPEVIFASNTSSIPITKIAEGSKHPETVIGMHYFSPVTRCLSSRSSPRPRPRRG